MKSSKREELERRIDEVLFYLWDPIGVCPNPRTRDEYRSYVRTISDMLNEGRDAFKIFSYLCELESGMLGIPANEGRAMTVATVLLDYHSVIHDGHL